MLGAREEGLLFVNKKKQKNFLILCCRWSVPNIRLATEPQCRHCEPLRGNPGVHDGLWGGPGLPRFARNDVFC